MTQTTLPQEIVLEINPFQPNVPESIRTVSPELYEFLRDMTENLRASHNGNQAGDTTFNWQLMLQVDARQTHTPGSLGSFYHPELGMIRGRYVQFTGMEGQPGLPVARVGGIRGLPWRVTGKESAVSGGAIIGLAASNVVPGEDSFGWIVTEGVNLNALYVDERPAAGSQIAAGTFVGGTLEEVDGKWKIPAGSVRLSLETSGGGGGTTVVTAPLEYGTQVRELEQRLTLLDGRNSLTIGILERRVSQLSKNRASVEVTEQLNAAANFANLAGVSAARVGHLANLSNISVTAIQQIRREVKAYRDEAGFHAESTTQLVNEAAFSANEGAESARAAAVFTQQAEAHATDAGNFAAAAEESALRAEAAAGGGGGGGGDGGAAEGFAAEAKAARDRAVQAEASALGSAASAKDSSDTSAASASRAADKALLAEIDAAAAHADALTASQESVKAAQKAAEALGYRDESATYASQADTFSDQASASATNAAGSAAAANLSQGTATAAAGSAEAAKLAAESARDTAGNSASQATDKALAAQQLANQAADSAAYAAGQATNAGNSAQDSLTYAGQSQTYRDQSSQSAVNAAGSAAAAAISEGTSAASASAAKDSQDAALASSASASTSAGQSSQSASNAAGSAASAFDYMTLAAQYRDEAQAVAGADLTAVNARITNEAKASADRDKAITDTVTSNRSEFLQANTDRYNENQSVAGNLAAEVQNRINAVAGVDTRVTTEATKLGSLTQVVTNNYSAFIQANTDRDQQTQRVDARVSTETQTRATADQAIVSRNDVMVAEYNAIGASLAVTQGVVAGLNTKTYAYLSIVAQVPGQRTQFTISAGGDNPGFDLVGNVRIYGDLLVSGTVTWGSLNIGSIGQIRAGSWAGDQTTSLGTPVIKLDPFDLVMPVNPSGVFTLEITVTMSKLYANSSSNIGGKIYYERYIDEGGFYVRTYDGYGLEYGRIMQGSGSYTFVIPLGNPYAFTTHWNAYIVQGTQNYIEDGGDYEIHYQSQSYRISNFSAIIRWSAV